MARINLGRFPRKPANLAPAPSGGASMAGDSTLVGVEVAADTATVRLTASDPAGLIIGPVRRPPGRCPTVAAELMAQAMSAA